MGSTQGILTAGQLRQIFPAVRYSIVVRRSAGPTGVDTGGLPSARVGQRGLI
jgi:hypothetical protein